MKKQHESLALKVLKKRKWAFKIRTSKTLTKISRTVKIYSKHTKQWIRAKKQIF